jgi:hypothetical protein
MSLTFSTTRIANAEDQLRILRNFTEYDDQDSIDRCGTHGIFSRQSPLHADSAIELGLNYVVLQPRNSQNYSSTWPMSIRQWSSFLGRFVVALFGTNVEQRISWCIRLKVDSNNVFLSYSSTILSSASMNNDNGYDVELADKFHVAFHNAISLHAVQH